MNGNKRPCLAMVLSFLCLATVTCSGSGSGCGSSAYNGNGGGGGGGTPPTYSVSGTVSGALQQGVSMNIADLAGTVSGTDWTDANGTYRFAGLQNGSYTITPQYPKYVFTPAIANVTIKGSDVLDVDFIATALPTHTVSGLVKDPVGGAFADVDVFLKGENGDVTRTDAQGNYSFIDVVDGTYSITPSMAGYLFAPRSLAVTVSGADSSGNDFTGSIMSWTTRTSGTVSQLLAVAWSGTQYVVVGNSYCSGSCSKSSILTSSDGAAWTAQDSGMIGTLNAVAWSGTLFVAVGSTVSSNSAVLTSPDGETWTPRSPGTASPLYGIAWSGTQFVAVGGTLGAGIVLTSPDAISWTSRDIGLANVLRAVAWSGTRFVAVGDYGVLFTSPDGAAWTAQTSTIFSSMAAVIWTGTRFMVAGAGGTILTSADGLSWIQPRPVTANFLSGIAWSGKDYMAVGQAVLTSPDAEIWTLQDPKAGAYLHGVASSGLSFVSVGDNGTIVSSP
jgi:hypothetical protein